MCDCIGVRCDGVRACVYAMQLTFGEWCVSGSGLKSPHREMSAFNAKIIANDNNSMVEQI